MRPYLAILIDSFREALYSRVLWMMFVVITLFLAIIFPLHFLDKLNSSFAEDDVASWPSLAEALMQGAPDAEGVVPSKAVARIYDTLSQESKSNLDKIARRNAATASQDSPAVEKNPDETKPDEKTSDDKAADEKKPDEKKPDDKQPKAEYRPEADLGEFFAEAQRLDRLHGDLRRSIRDKDFYDADAWQGITLKKEARDLIDQGENRTDDERRRLNRLLVEQQFPNIVSVSESRAFGVKYAIWDLPFPFPLPREMVKRQIPVVATQLIDVTFGIFGIALSFLVTAPLITQMFEPGALHVLLSKPISRSLLLLSKFVGGCFFTVLGSSYLLIGMWLYMGIQLQLWEPGLLAGIPVYVCTFAVYFTVVVAAALFWRNAMIAIVAGLLFWAFCFGLGSTYVGLDSFAVQPARPRAITVANKIPIIARQNGETYEWVSDNWRPSFRSAESRGPFNITVTLHGPLYVPARNEVVSIQSSPFRGAEGKLSVAGDEPNHPREAGPDLPLGTCGLFIDKRGDLLVVGVVGILKRAPNNEAKPKSTLFGFNLSFGANKDFQSVGIYDLESPPRTAAYDPEQDRIALLSDGQLAVLKADESHRYEQQRVVTVEGDEFKNAKVAFAGDRIIVAGRDGKIALVDAQSLEVVKKLQLENNNGVRYAMTSPDGKIAVLGLDTGRLYLLRASNPDQFEKLNVWDQGDLWAATFEDSANLLVAQSRGRLVRYRIGESSDSSATERQPGVVADPPMVLAEKIYYWGIKPLYNTCPKPGELKRTLIFLLTGKETLSFGNNQHTNEVYRGSPWAPLTSSAIFVVVVLALACIYFERQDL